MLLFARKIADCQAGGGIILAKLPLAVRIGTRRELALRHGGWQGTATREPQRGQSAARLGGSRLVPEVAHHLLVNLLRLPSQLH